MKKAIAFFLFIVLPGFGLMAQNIHLAPVLIGPAGGSGQAGDVHITWSTGESVITTASSSSMVFTQGFQQPRVTEDMYILANSYDAACLGSNDGAAAITVVNGTGPFTYTWSPSVSTSDTASSLSPGLYTVIVEDMDGATDTIELTIRVLVEAGCELHIYSGITPNGDGINDTWEVDGLSSYADNSVQIFNRWGDKVWAASKYNNRDIIWEGNNQNGTPLPEGTYFYIISITGKQFTGWVEITR